MENLRHLKAVGSIASSGSIPAFVVGVAFFLILHLEVFFLLPLHQMLVRIVFNRAITKLDARP